MIVDMHAHAQSFEPVIAGRHTPDTLVAAMEGAGVDMALLSMFDRDPAVANDLTRAACERFAGRLYGYVYLNPHDVEGSVRELERCAAVDVFRGVKLHPANDVYFPFLETYHPVYARIEQLGLPILWHSGTSPNSHPLQIAVVAKAFPRVPHILAHFALADLSWECFPAAALSPNVHVDTSGNPIIPVMDEWVERFGAERMLWGSDYPFYQPAYERLKIDHLACSAADRQKILAGNARRLFRLPAA